MIVMTSGRPKTVEAASKVELRTPSFLVKPSQNERLLGCIVQNNCKWSEYIRDSKENSLISALNKRVAALNKIGKVTSFRQRKMFGNGIFMSKINYCISVWGGCSKELLKSLQVCQNRAARAITKNDWTVSTKENLNQIGWLNVNQTVFYFSALLMFKVRYYRQPQCLSSMFNWNYSHQTRAATSGIIKPIGTAHLSLAQNSFRWRAAVAFNSLPEHLRSSQSIEVFKSKLRLWVKENV